MKKEIWDSGDRRFKARKEIPREDDERNFLEDSCATSHENNQQPRQQEDGIAKREKKNLRN